MKKTQKIIVTCAVLFCIVVSGAAMAADPQDHQFPKGALHRPHGNMGIILLSRYMQKNLVTQVLSDLTEKPVGTLDQQLREQRLPAVLDEYRIDRESFRAAMRAKMHQLVRQLAANGFLTAEQEKDFVEKMENQAQRHALMRRLVEKGVEDETITREQAQMLLRKPR
jgi:polyhydroxyalkanoate synthesis regulator phasin